MPEPSMRRSPRKLSAETQWEVFLSVAAGEITQADAARKWQVDVSSTRLPARVVATSFVRPTEADTVC